MDALMPSLSTRSLLIAARHIIVILLVFLACVYFGRTNAAWAAATRR